MRLSLLTALAAVGCAPLTTLPPPTAPGDGHAVGVSGGGLGQVGSATTSGLPSEHVHGSLWGDLRVSQRTRVGVVVGGSGRQDLWSAGGVVRYSPMPDAPTGFSINAEGGLFWAGGGVTVHREVGPVRLCTSPSVVMKGTPWARLPLGVAGSWDHWVIGGELGLTSSLAPADHPMGPRGLAYAGLTVGWRFAPR